MIQSSISIFGEVLFDIFPNGKAILGGAPFNVAWHLQAFGANPKLITRIGHDQEGEQIKQALTQWSMDTSCLQHDQKYPTGKVTVSLQNGEPSYCIEKNCAYDFIETDNLKAIPKDEFLYHGTLALRNPTSAKTLEQIKKQHRGKIFIDVNLRPPFWDKAQVHQLLQQAHWVKLNTQELNLLDANQTDIEVKIYHFKKQFNLEGLILTMGENGSFVIDTDDRILHQPPIKPTTIKDTVGAGDAYSAVFLLGLINHWNTSQIMERAQQFATAIIANQGATNQNKDFYYPWLKSWSLDNNQSAD